MPITPGGASDCTGTRDPACRMNSRRSASRYLKPVSTLARPALDDTMHSARLSGSEPLNSTAAGSQLPAFPAFLVVCESAQGRARPLVIPGERPDPYLR